MAGFVFVRGSVPQADQNITPLCRKISAGWGSVATGQQGDSHGSAVSAGGAPALPTGCTYGLPARAGSAKVKAHGKDGGNVACGSTQIFVSLGKGLVDGAGAVEHA